MQVSAGGEVFPTPNWCINFSTGQRPHDYTLYLWPLTLLACQLTRNRCCIWLWIKTTWRQSMAHCQLLSARWCQRSSGCELLRMQNFQCSFLSVMIDATLPKIHFLPVSPTFLQFFASSLTSVFIITLNFSLFGVLTIISCQLCYIWLTAFPPVYHITLSCCLISSK